MPSLKPSFTAIRAAFVVAVALGVAGQSLEPASAQVFRSRKDMAKKQCEEKHAKFSDESSGKYSCTDEKERKITKCDALDKCTTSDMPAPKSTSAAPAKPKSLLGTGHVTKAQLKKICAQNKDWIYSEEKSSTRFSCVDSADGVAINCKKENDCTEAHTPVHAH